VAGSTGRGAANNTASLSLQTARSSVMAEAEERDGTMSPLATSS
jgi:hypothetical protein